MPQSNKLPASVLFVRVIMTQLLSLSSTLDVAVASSEWNCIADLHFPSPHLCVRSVQVCSIMCAEAETCMCDWGRFPAPAPPHLLIRHPFLRIPLWITRHFFFFSKGAVRAASASLRHPSLQQSSPSLRAFNFQKQPSPAKPPTPT